MRSRRTKKILFLAPYPSGKAPSQRFRYEQYLEILKKAGFETKTQSFIDDNTWRILYKQANFFGKISGIATGFFRRIAILLSINSYSFVFIHREASPIGPPIFEWIIARVFKRKIIYDFDDAIWRPQFLGKGNFLKNFLKNSNKVSKICSWSYRVSCGNDYLKEYASKYNSNVILNPTTIDTSTHHNQIKDQNTEKFVIGWTGTHSTLCHLETKIEVIKALENNYDFEFVVIANEAPEFKFKSLTFKEWDKATEIQDLLNFNIGVMPLLADEWTKGKCGFKALQYMSLGIPAIVSSVGVNSEIVDHGINGFVCDNENEWKDCIIYLMKNREERIRMGTAARAKIDKFYSVKSNESNFLSLFT